MRILLVRHGRSEGNVDESLYDTKGDCNIALTDEGWGQARDAGKFLGTLYKESKKNEWPRLYVSSYLRTQQTLRGLLVGIDDAIPGKPKILEDPRLVEKNFGAIASLIKLSKKGDLSAQFAKMLLNLSQDHWKKNPFVAKSLFGDSAKDTHLAVKQFIDGTLSRAIENKGHDDFVIVTHGAVIKPFLMSWAHMPMSQERAMKTPGNCDVICIEGEPGNWKIRTIYDGENQEAVNYDPFENVEQLTIDTLPPAPDWLKQEL